MPFEKSAGAVVFHRQPNGKIEYLLLEHRAGHWAFPKGLIERNESPEETAKREIEEETGITKISLIPGFKETQKYFFKVKYDYQLERGWKKGESVFKIVTFFLVEAKNQKVKISEEHIGYKWLLYKEALEQLTFKNAKEILRKANEFLMKRIDLKLKQV